MRVDQLACAELGYEVQEGPQHPGDLLLQQLLLSLHLPTFSLWS